MVYVERRSGKIVGVYACQQDGYAEELVEDDNQEVLAFRNPVTITDYENAIQNLVDETARERQFRDGVTLASYIGSTIQTWAAEAQSFVAWRDNVWSYAYGEFASVQAGQRQQPTVEQFLAEIAPIAWPNNSV
ncbi:hypothetical protein [Agrobacterium salinitolerans]|uniref:hypothetical protein n=1 Tax=Agrobacterium salinitolerans TaxID=1183413 RepID=UPI0022B81720|nr:hypothetical protein [Agrobacterium salinitolerans]MCZ7886060.1 hypothetical protein [Agrobacterium salinitolerans]